MPDLFQNPIVGVIGIVVVLVLLVWLIASRYRVAKPNEAFVITGRGGKRHIDPATGQTTVDLSGQKVVRGGGAFIIPLIQQLSVLDLSSHRIEVGVAGAYNSKGIKLNVRGVAIVKVGSSDEAVRAAAQRFSAQQEAVEEFCKEVLTGSLRSIIGAMDVDKIISDRAEFARKVAEASEADLSNQGLVIDTFQIQDIADAEDGTYLRDLGRPEAARIRQQADIAEADAFKQSEQAKAAAAQAIAEAKRDLALKNASIQQETDKASAVAANAGPLEKAAQEQQLVSAQQEVAAQQAILTEKQLDATIRRQADARRYETETQAAAAKAAALLKAEAEKASRIAAADALKAEGDAQAAAKLATGTAEADVLDKKAEAYAKYNQAAVLDMLVKVLPEVAHEVSAPMSAIDQLTVISTDGASDLTKKATSLMTELPAVVKSLTGVDIADLLKGFVPASEQPAVTSTAAVPVSPLSPADTPSA